MRSAMTKHQVGRAIFRNLHGHYPYNISYNDEDKLKLDKIRRQLTRSIEGFSELWNDFTIATNGKVYISTNVANLIIIEVTHRFRQISTRRNIRRTKILGYIAHHNWCKLTAEDIGFFLCPFLDTLKVTNPASANEIEHLLSHIEVGDEVLNLLDKLLILFNPVS